MPFFAVRTRGGGARPPGEVIEADAVRRFARVVVFVRGGREVDELAAERVERVARFDSRIDAEAWLADRPLAAGTSPAAGRRWRPPEDLPPLVPGPGSAPSRKLTPTPLSAVLDTSGERVAVSPSDGRVEEVDIRLRRGAGTPTDAGEE